MCQYCMCLGQTGGWESPSVPISFFFFSNSHKRRNKDVLEEALCSIKCSTVFESFRVREAKLSFHAGAEQQRRRREEVMFSPPLGVTVSSVRV